jgi:hypothetical protein
MKYEKNLINDLFEIKEKLEEKDKNIVERFIAQYNHMYADYRNIQEQRYATRKMIDENEEMKEKIKKYKIEIKKLKGEKK